MLTRITDRKILCIYIHVCQITENWGPCLYNSLCHADNRRYFWSLSLMWNQREAHVLLGKGSGKIWTCSCFKTSNIYNVKRQVCIFHLILVGIPSILILSVKNRGWGGCLLNGQNFLNVRWKLFVDSP